MKSLKIFSFAVAIAVMLSSCAASWLDTQTKGSTLTQDQFDALTNPTDGLVNGLYSLLYATSSSDHHYFGQKSIDMATDLLSSDMAMTLNAYGWFTDAATRTCSTASSSRNSYIWSYYYTIIMNANTAIRKMAPYQNEFTEDQMASYAQALVLRAYCYYNLATLYNPGIMNDTPDNFVGGTGLGYSSIPIYTENDTTESGLIKEQYVSSVGEAYEFAISDLQTAIAYFDSIDYVRSNKLVVNSDVARGLLAYCYLEHQQYGKAYTTAKDFIDLGHFSLIPLDKVLTTGFVSVEDNSWIWGLDVTIENTGSLASFWGHMDTHTYSYASAGTTKAIDENLFKLIPTTDIRRQWFDTTNKYTNDYKFYDLARGETADQLDRRWLNDIVFMRIEEMYLIGAEAAFRNNQSGLAKDLIKTLLEQRDETLAAQVDGWSNTELRDQIYYNWRVEMWGEGRALATFKRFGDAKTRGNNHYNGAGESVSVSDINLTFQTPNGEINTNSTFFSDEE